MKDTSLYQQILGLADPWFVTDVKLAVEKQRVDIFVEHTKGAKWCCPVCCKPAGLYDHAEERVWRHLDSCQFQTFLHARVPRVACPEHGIHNANLPWGERGSRFTMLMERLIINVLQECQSILGACRLLGISWDEAMGVMTRAVRRGQSRKKQRPLKHIGADEKSVKRGHHYVTVVCDLEESSVEYVGEGRGASALAAFYQQLPASHLQAIQAVALDMCVPFIRATLEHVPQAQEKIVFDRFHIMKHANEAMDRVRQGENRRLSRAGDETLSQSRHLWLWGKENLPDKHRERFDQLRQRDLDTGRAWAMKENLRRLWDQTSLTQARRIFTRWCNWVQRSQLKPMMNLAKTLKAKAQQILNYIHHRITSGVCEGINSKIMTIKRKAAGYRNIEHFKQAILFYCGKLDLHPR